MQLSASLRRRSSTRSTISLPECNSLTVSSHSSVSTKLTLTERLKNQHSQHAVSIDINTRSAQPHRNLNIRIDLHLIMGISNHASHEKESALTDGVVAAGEVVRGILLTGDQLLRVEELTVGTLQKKKVSISGFDPPQNQRI